MRLFLAIPRSPNPSFTSDLWKANLHDPLVDMGHDVVLWDEGSQPLFDLDPDAPETVPVRARFSDRFLQAVEAAHRSSPFDLVITYFSDSHVEPQAIDRVRERIAPIVNFFCNNVHQFHLVQRTARHYVTCLVPEGAAFPRYLEAGAEPIFFPMAANPKIYRPVPAEVRYDVTFAGQRYGDRTAGMLALREGGIDAHAFGQHWTAAPVASTAKATGDALSERPRRASRFGSMTRAVQLLTQGRNPLQAARDVRDWERLSTRYPGALHGPVGDDAYVALFSESKISLGFLILGDTHRTRRPLRQVRLREFEAPMAGAFYLTGWLFDELAMHYEIGNEIVCYQSIPEMVDLARYYLTHDSERERIRVAGHERAMRDHTWQRRFEDLFTELRRKGILRS
jgi:spore maturation protein CgeB